MKILSNLQGLYVLYLPKYIYSNTYVLCRHVLNSKLIEACQFERTFLDESIPGSRQKYTLPFSSQKINETHKLFKLIKIQII